METNNNKASAGKRGDAVRSDCYIEIEIKPSGGLHLNIKSKVASMYSDDIKKQLTELCNYFHIKNAEVTFEDYGALPFVISARFELAVKRIYPDIKKEFLPAFNKNNLTTTIKERLRRSRLYLPGNEPKFFLNAGLHEPDGIILDLEDSVAPAEKDAAQLLVRNALRAVNFYKCERMVRINQLPRGLNDLRYVVPNNVNVVLIPKVENAQQIHQIENEIDKLKKEFNISYDIFLMPIIESALGIINAYQIASSSPLICSLAIGLEDYTADLGTQRTNEGKESFFARSMVVNAAKAAGVQAIDTVFSDVNDMEALRQSVLEAKSLGFEGKGCIHPRQVKIVHDALLPTPEEIEKAKKIVEAYNDAIAKGLGVVSLGSKMIDAPVVKRAIKTLSLVQNN
ncbi:MAG TPA: aldolase/citrate lyase family protein [Ignavibacteriaceae bacterium]|nr:aldolase/citrate lyase family protein [Ignavibacteriaceae bacterium]